MSRTKLQQLGVDVPILPATTVGSAPVTRELVAAEAAALRGELDAEGLAVKHREACAAWIATQEAIGLDILTDGEPGRGDGVAWFAGHLKGFKPGGLVRTRGNRFVQRLVLAGEVRWTAPVTVRLWAHAQGLTQKPVKATLPGPYSLMDASFNERYPTRQAACRALARELRREADALVKAGCRILQLDEPALGGRPEELEVAGDAIRVVTKDLAAYVVVHVCYGSLDPVWPGLLDLPADNLDIEMVNGDFTVGRSPAKAAVPKDVSIGVIDVLSAKADTPETILRRVKKALTVLKPEQVWVDPDCGLRHRAPEEAVAQLTAMVAAALAARKGRGG